MAWSWLFPRNELSVHLRVGQLLFALVSVPLCRCNRWLVGLLPWVDQDEDGIFATIICNGLYAAFSVRLGLVRVLVEITCVALLLFLND